MLDRVDPCGAQFVKQVLDAHLDMADQLDSLPAIPDSSPIVDQMASSAQTAIDQFGALTGADLGRAFVFNEKFRADQLIDLIDNRIKGGAYDPTVASAVDTMRTLLADRSDVADEVANTCGYAPIDLGH